MKTTSIPNIALNRRLSFRDRFWKHVDKSSGENACWPWIGARAAGYGQFYMGTDKGKKYFGRAHRIAWEMKNGIIPIGLELCHKCDNKACCNTDHMFLGTHKDNINDAIQKGRMGRHKKF